LCGIGAGIALGVLAGARRTDTAVSRFVAYARPDEAQVQAQDPKWYAAVSRLPEVQRSVLGAYLVMAPLDARGQLNRALNLNTIVVVQGATTGRWKMLGGRVPREDDPSGVIINPGTARDAHLHVGDELRFRAFTADQTQALLRGDVGVPKGQLISVRVDGIARAPGDLSVAPSVPGVLYQGSDDVVLTPAFYARYGNGIANTGVGLAVRLVSGEAGVPAFAAHVAQVTGGQAQVYPSSDDLDAARLATHATRVEALALLLFGSLVGILTLAMVGQALVRHVRSTSDDDVTLRALGLTTRQALTVGVLRATILGLGAAAIALGVAYVISARMPIGLARQAEVHPGYAFDPLVLGAGAVALVLVLAALGALASGGPRGRGAAGPGVAHAVAPLGMGPSATVGVRMALQPGRGRTAVAVRTTMLTAVIGIAAVAATLVFGANLGRLATVPRLQGWNWDVSVGNPHSDDVSKTAVPLLVSNPSVAGTTSVAGPIPVRLGDSAGQDGLFSFGVVKGTVFPVVTAGRPPRGPNEIALGALTLRHVHKRIGDALAVSAGGAPHTFTITSTIVLTPAVVNDQIPLGAGAVVTPEGLRALGAANPDVTPVNVFLIRFVPHVDRAQAMATLQADFPGTVLPAIRPPDVENLQRVSDLPPLLAAVLAGVAIMTVGHMLASSVRRRRRDFAVLQTIGFVRRQVSAAVAWQAVAVAVVALCVGLPIGIAAGRWAWLLVTHQLGLASVTTVPIAIAALVPAAILAANVAAALPGFVANRMKPAAVLTTE
jgi:hypothetical protein